MEDYKQGNPMYEDEETGNGKCLFSHKPVMGPISPSEYTPEYIHEGLNRYADWLETASGGYANQSARGF